MTKSASLTTPPPVPDGDIMRKRRDIAREFIGGQEKSNSWKPIIGSRPVEFMKLRAGMCRWPIGDPHHLETFRFCGCAVSAAAIYCEAHAQLASVPGHSRQAPPRKPAPPVAVKAA